MKKSSQKNIILMVSVTLSLFIILYIAGVFKKNKPEREPVYPEDETIADAIVELESIKDKIKETEDNNEYYRSETNHGLTVVGTLLEQMIDIMVAVLSQPLVAEAISRRVVSQQDANELSEYIELLGEEVVKEINQSQILKCNDDKTENCTYYELNQHGIEEGTKRSVVSLYNKVLDIVTKAEEQDKIYRITKNTALTNLPQLGYMDGWSESKIRERTEQAERNWPPKDKITKIAVAHYKYLGENLKKELGESVNTVHLTDEEKEEVRHSPFEPRFVEGNTSVKPTPVDPNKVRIRATLYRKENFNEEFADINGEMPKGEVMTLGENEEVGSFKLSEGVSLEGLAKRRRGHRKKYETITISGPAEIADVRALGIKDSYTSKYYWNNIKLYVAGDKKVGEKVGTVKPPGAGGIFGGGKIGTVKPPGAGGIFGGGKIGTVRPPGAGGIFGGGKIGTVRPPGLPGGKLQLPPRPPREVFGGGIRSL